MDQGTLPLVSTLLTRLLDAVANARALLRRSVVDPLLNPNVRISRARFLRMMETLFVCEARTRRDIFETAMAMLGAPCPRQPLRVFRLTRPRTPRELGARLRNHARMSAHADWYAWRLARRLRRMVRATREPIGRQLARILSSPMHHASDGLATAASTPSRPEASFCRRLVRQRAPPLPQRLPRSP